MRLARTHIFGVAGDTLVTVALAGSLFFSVDPTAARGNVALYLALTIAPFAIVAPLIGPAIDRAAGGRRLMMVVAATVRGLIALLMVRHLDSLWLYPEAFAVLVSGKAYHVAKSAIVPTLVQRETELVEANSKLVLLGGIAGALAFPPGVGLRFLHDGMPLVLASAAFLVSGLAAWRLPSTAVAIKPADDLERAELRSASVLLAASAMALLRAIVGFLTFLIVFWLRSEDAPIAWFGVVGIAAVVGNLSGAISAPLLRRVVREELLLGGVMVLTAVVAFASAAGPSRLSAAALALTVGASTSLGKLSFDAIVQRNAPDANQGRSFAKFETRFQLAWVVAALIPVLFFEVLPIWLGFLILAIASSVGSFFFLGGLRAIARGVVTPGDRLKRRLLEDDRVQKLGDRLPRRKRSRSDREGDVGTGVEASEHQFDPPIEPTDSEAHPAIGESAPRPELGPGEPVFPQIVAGEASFPQFGGTELPEPRRADPEVVEQAMGADDLAEPPDHDGGSQRASREAPPPGQIPFPGLEG